MKLTKINLREEQWAKLQMLCQKTGPTASALIRKAIDAYLDESSVKDGNAGRTPPVISL